MKSLETTMTLTILQLLLSFCLTPFVDSTTAIRFGPGRGCGITQQIRIISGFADDAARAASEAATGDCVMASFSGSGFHAAAVGSFGGVATDQTTEVTSEATTETQETAGTQQYLMVPLNFVIVGIETFRTLSQYWLFLLWPQP